MPAADAAKAIAALNDKEYQQRTLKVREANDKRDKDEREGSEVDA
jgi:RNA recognition motif-containing protein